MVRALDSSYCPWSDMTIVERMPKNEIQLVIEERGIALQDICRYYDGGSDPIFPLFQDIPPNYILGCQKVLYF